MNWIRSPQGLHLRSTQGMAQNDRKAEVSGLKFAVVLIMQIITTALPLIIGGTSDV